MDNLITFPNRPRNADEYVASLTAEQRKALHYSLFTSLATLYKEAAEDFDSEDWTQVGAVIDALAQQLKQLDGPQDAHIVTALCSMAQQHIQETVDPEEIDLGVAAIVAMTQQLADAQLQEPEVAGE